MDPKVSILIPCYNSAAFIDETIQCCIGQTYANIEIVIVDDGSKDNSLEIIRKYESDKVKIISQTNLGACCARNLAFQHCTGDYILYLDADDVINSEFVACHMCKLKPMDCRTISFCPWDRFYKTLDDAKFPHLNIYKDYDDAFQLLLDMWMTGNMLANSCYVIPKQLVIESNGWNETILKNQDGEFFSRILMLAHKALFIPDARTYYRTGSYDSVSKGTSYLKIRSFLDSLVLYKKNALNHENTERVKMALAQNFSLFIYLYYNLYPDLCEIAKRETLDMGVSLLPAGPYKARVLSRLIGLEPFLKLKKFIKRK